MYKLWWEGSGRGRKTEREERKNLQPTLCQKMYKALGILADLRVLPGRAKRKGVIKYSAHSNKNRVAIYM